MKDLAPPSSRRSFAIALDRRLREVPPAELPLVPRGVFRALAGRANANAYAWPAIKTIAYESGAGSVATVRRALAELVDLGWIEVAQEPTARTSTVYKLHLTPKRGAKKAAQTDRSGTPGVPEKLARGIAPTPEDHREGHKEDHKEATVRKRARKEKPCTTITPAAAPTPSTTPQPSRPETLAPHAGATANATAATLPTLPIRAEPAAATAPAPAASRFSAPRTQLSLLDVPELDPADVVEAPPTSRSPAAAPPLPAAARRKRGAKSLPKASAAPSEEPKEDAATRYSRAWQAGHQDAGADVLPLAAAEVKLLGTICGTFARYRTGEPIVGAELERWIRETAARFRRGVDPRFHPGKYGVYGLKNWIEAVDRINARWRKPGDELPVPAAVPRPAPRELPPGQGEAIAKRRLEELFT